MKTLSKALSTIENGGPQSLALLKDLYSKKRGVPILGMTGLPGAGKSTLVDQLIEHIRSLNKTVGVIAIDPSSPFSGGALLGDRVRMQRHTSDEGVFIRSVGSRGAHGGLSRAAKDLALCFDAFGFDQIIIETVGVGQTELDIMGLATTTVVVLMPGSGDAIQTLKAGLMEIADIFVVNKSDLIGADAMQAMLQAMITMQEKQIPIVATQADARKGIKELWKSIEEHRKTLEQDPEQAGRQQTLRRTQFLELVGDWYKQKMQEQLTQDPKVKSLLEKVAKNEINPFEALERIFKEL